MEANTASEPGLSKCPEPIAIVGMGCRWPGGIHDESQLWKLLVEKQHGYSEFKKDRINVEGFYHPKQGQPGGFPMRGGCFLQEDPRLFDNGLFRINAVETKSMDPAQRKLLEVTFEAFENAGEPWDKFTGSRTGVFVGNFMSDHQNMQFRDPDNLMPYDTTGGDIAIHSNRINYVFNLQGPSLTLDTACSSALYALHLAVLGLRNGDCDAAIVAGSNLISDPGSQMLISKLGALSPTSVCHTFDASADGYARAEGIGALYIMPLNRAVAGSYPIRAVIRGTAINANGGSQGISYPSVTGQENVIRQAYKNAGGLNPGLTSYFEAHGTGTPVGDPIEVSAIGRVFSQSRDDGNPLLIGSIKPNLGHSEPASAIASIMKVVMALERGEIPPTRGITNFNPTIDFKTSRTKVVQEVTPWPSLTIRRASVNSFGYGGANAHVILEHVNSIIPGYHMRRRRLLVPRIDNFTTPPTSTKSSSMGSSNEGDTTPPSTISISPTTDDKSSESLSQRLLLLPFSANDAKSLSSTISSIASVADDHEPLRLAHTLANRRSAFSQRAFIVGSTESLSSSLISAKIFPTKSPLKPRKRIGFIFTGQGAQWPSMGRELLRTYPKFLESIRYQDSILAKLSNRPLWRIEDVLMDDKIAHTIHEPIVSQTVCSGLQIALVDLLSSCAVNPSATVGHSSGEIAAAYAAGRLTASTAIVIAYSRGYTVSKNERQGAMLAVGLGVTDVESYLVGLEAEVKVAAINSPNSVTLSGENDAIERLSERMQKDSVFNRVLKTGGNAYHSHHMEKLGSMYEDEVRKSLGEVSESPGSIEHRVRTTWISSVTPDANTDDIEVGPSYWRQNLESPVCFGPALEKLMEQYSEDPLDLLLEIGPHAALAGPVKQILQVFQFGGNSPPLYLGTLKRGEDDLASILELGGSLFVHGVPIQIDPLNDPRGLLKSQYPLPFVRLPNYKYNYGPILFHENRLNKEWRLRKHPRHDLLGTRDVGSTSLNPSWRNIFRIKDIPWLADHRLTPQAIFPAAGFIAMAVEAAAQCHGEVVDASPILGFTLRNVKVSSTLEVPDTETGTEVVLNVQKEAHKGTWVHFRITSLSTETEAWIEHCTGSVKIETNMDSQTRNSIDEVNFRPADIVGWYSKFKAIGLEYGPCFRALSDLKIARNRASAKVDLTPTKSAAITVESPYWLHPASLDNCLQLANIAAFSGQSRKAKRAYIPVMFDGITIWNRRGSEITGPGRAIAEAEMRGNRGMYSRILLRTSSGEVLMDMDLFRGISYDGKSFLSPEEEEKPQYPFSRLSWKPDIDTLSTEKARKLFCRRKTIAKDVERTEMLDKLFVHALVDIWSRFQHVSIPEHQSHLEKYMSWIRSRCFLAQEGNVPFGLEATTASPDIRSQTINSLFEDMGGIVETKFLRRIFENLSNILSGSTTGLELALQGDLLSDLYQSSLGVTAAYSLLQDLVDLLAHKAPRMNILELGGGTGGATARVLETLGGGTPFGRYRSFTFTDQAPTFVSSAEQRFSDNAATKFSVLNIESDPQEQGFESDYDLVIASQVLHATTSLARTLQNVRRLLKPNGKLLLVEFTSTHPISTLGLGTFPYYWNGAADGRTEGPLAGRKRWHSELLRNGFSGIDIVLGDDNIGGEAVSVILSSALPQIDIPSQPSKEPDVIIVTHAEPTSFAQSVARKLAQDGATCSLVKFSDISAARGSRFICLADLENPGTIPDEAYFKNMKRLLSNALSILWVFLGSTFQQANPSIGLVTGLLRPTKREMPQSKISMLEFGTDFDNSSEYVDQIVTRERKLHLDKDHAQTDDLEIYQDGCIYISRLDPDMEANHRYRVQEELDTTVQMTRLGSCAPIKATTTRPGLLSSLQFKTDWQMLQPLPDDWVEITSEAIDINMTDLATITGKFDSKNYSIACCGIVNRVGSRVEHLQIGDRVCGFALGNYGNVIRCPAVYQQRMKLTDDPVEMVSLPISYMTALYALRNLAHIEKGDTVLIQSAAGALGLATMRLAQHFGADIYVTVGNSKKKQFLQDNFGISEDRIFSSRALETPNMIWNATQGQGIDVIICSTAGDQMQEFWRCIAPLGRFVEVGRVDVLSHERLPLEVFKRNATFSSFDVSLLSQQKPKLGASLMAEVCELYRQGVIQPIDRITSFDVSELQKAMMYMAKGEHIGKVVVTYKNPDSLVPLKPSSPRTTFNPEGSYILIGCMAGVGHSINNWMVERGAKHLVHLSRSGTDNPQAKSLLESMVAYGIDVVVKKCDVTVKQDVEAAIAEVRSVRPIRGIIHAAAVFEDVSFQDLQYSKLQRVLAPKVQGTINLHEATLQQPLDFFMMTSSIVAILGTATQASYSAANSFQDAFARFRRAQGLPAQSFAMGMISDVGFASSREDIHRSLTRNGIYGTSSPELVTLLDVAFMSSGAVNSPFDPLADAHLLVGLEPRKIYNLDKTSAGTEFPWSHDPRFGRLLQSIQNHHLKQQESAHGNLRGGSSSDLTNLFCLAAKLKSEKTSSSDDVRQLHDLAVDVVAGRLATLLFTPQSDIDIAREIADYGIDSMITAELRNWLFNSFRLNISFIELVNKGVTVQKLAKIVEDKLLEA